MGITLIHHLVLENVPVPRQALLEINNHLVGLAHRPDLDPRLEVGLLGQLQHVADVLPGTDQGTGDLEVLEDIKNSLLIEVQLYLYVLQYNIIHLKY